MIAASYAQYLCFWSITCIWSRWAQLMYPESTVGKTLAAMH